MFEFVKSVIWSGRICLTGLSYGMETNTHTYIQHIYTLGEVTTQKYFTVFNLVITKTCPFFSYTSQIAVFHEVPEISESCGSKIQVYAKLSEIISVIIYILQENFLSPP